MKIKRFFPYAAILVLTFLYLLGLSKVPFHPDESTQIFMSADVETVFSRPAELLYTPSPAEAQRQNYRLLDAPLSRWLIGLGRLIAGESALTTDWDWSKTWEQNQAAGALPDQNLLITARFSVAWLFALTLLFGYRAGMLIGGSTMGGVMIGLLSINALVLMHTRRAMAESALLFSITWFIFAIAKKETNPLLLALPAAFAVNAKQTAAALVLIVLFAAWLYSNSISWPKRARNVAVSATLIILITYMLNPVAWKNPADAMAAAIKARSDLAARQTEVIGAVSPELLLKSPAQRLAGWMVYLYISEPATADVKNYVDATRKAEAFYFTNPIHRFLRGILPGILMLVLSLLGFLLAAYTAAISPPCRNQLSLLLFSTLAAFLTLMIFIPLPFQRYSILLVPFSTLWSAYSLNWLSQRWIKKQGGLNLPASSELSHR